MNVDFKKNFEYENGFYLTSQVNRISKFVTHLDLYRKITNLPGEIIETGVFKGASLSRFVKFRSLLENAFSRKIIAFDTFGKFPEAYFEDDKAIRNKFIEEAGEISISETDLLNIYSKLGLNENLKLIAGDIGFTVPQFVTENPQIRIALLHVDVDLYEPTKVVLENLYPMVVQGGIVLLDDYGAFPGANLAIEEYFEHLPVKLQKLPFSNAITFLEKE
jgi:hypothetical protein